MTQEEVIARFCALSTEVMSKKFEFQAAADCFCGENNFKGVSFQFSERVVEFIEDAVHKALDSAHTQNQCDGCCRGLTLVGEIHTDPQGRAVMVCQASKY